MIKIVACNYHSPGGDESTVDVTFSGPRNRDMQNIFDMYNKLEEAARENDMLRLEQIIEDYAQENGYNIEIEEEEDDQ